MSKPVMSNLFAAFSGKNYETNDVLLGVYSEMEKAIAIASYKMSDIEYPPDFVLVRAIRANEEITTSITDDRYTVFEMNR